jgi:3-phenylpropionate/trans-cinnamate dioxygenase ferredoxin component
VTRLSFLNAQRGGQLIAACALADLPLGGSFRLAVDPPVAVFRTEDGAVFAIDDTCTHQDASLSDGWVDGCEVECPLHSSRFDLRTGKVDAPPAKLPVRTYPVVVRDGTIFVEAGRPVEREAVESEAVESEAGP